MRKYRILYGIILLASLLLFILSNHPTAGALSLSMILIPLMIGVWNRYNARKIEISMEMNPGVEKGKECILYFNIKNPSKLASGMIRMEMVWNNKWLGEEYKEVIFCPSHTGKSNRHEVHFKSRHCGRLVCSVSQVTIYDLFGITGYRIKKEVRQSSIIYPSFCNTMMDKFSVPDAWKESEVYRAYQRGNDQSEWYGVHEYRPGDPIKSIHWKLSVKLQGELLVREYGYPIGRDVLVLADIFREYQGKKIHSDRMDGVITIVATIAYALTKRMEFHMGWYDTVTNRCRIRKVSKSEDILETLQEILSTPAPKEGSFAARHYLFEQEKKPFTKVYYISCEGTEELLEQLHITQETKVILVRDQNEAYAETTYGISTTVREIEESVSGIVI